MRRAPVIGSVLTGVATIAVACSGDGGGSAPSPILAPLATAMAPVTPVPATSAATARPPPSLLSPTRPPDTGSQIDLSAVRDTTLYEDPNGSLGNGEGKFVFVGRNGGGATRRTLIVFDVAGKLPVGSRVVSAALGMRMSQTTSSPQPVELHRALAAWGEGSSAASANGGGGATAQPGDATWLHRFFDTVRWNSPGGDFSPSVTATALVGSAGAYAWGPSPEMVSDVQDMLDRPGSNFGWVMVGEESFPRTSKRFASRENQRPGDRPVLSVLYRPPG